MKVIPLGKTEINWDVLLATAKVAFDRSITKETDKKNWNLDSKTFLAALQEIRNPGVSPTNIFNKPHPMSGHLYYNFIFIISSGLFSLLIEDLSLNFYSANCQDDFKFCFLSGSLTEWKSSIDRFCHPDSDERIAKLFHQCRLAFEKEGLHLWKEFKKQGPRLLG